MRVSSVRGFAPWLCSTAVLLAAAGAWGQCSPDTVLGPGSSFGVGELPLNVAIGDVNGDGFPDVVTGNFFGYSVSILFGDGTGSLGGHIELPLIVDPDSNFGAGANQPAVGDLNGDGLADIVVGVTSPDLGNPGFAAFLQQPGGTFADPVFYAFSTQVRGVRLADMNNDGFLDVVYSNHPDNTLNIAPGNGDGTFEPELFTTYSGGPSDTFIADFNSDGSLDVAAPAGGDVIIALNDGFGNLSESARYAIPASGPIAGGDFNGDGTLDLAVADLNGHVVHVLLGNSDGTFQPAQTSSAGAGSSPLGIGVADLNNDGLDDLITVQYLGGGVRVLMSQGDGTFGLSNVFATGARPRSIAAADLNGDGVTDVVVANQIGNSVTTLLSQCVGTAPICLCETDGNDAQVDVFDLLAYLDLWFAGDAAAEMTGDDPALVDVFDLLAFLDCWFPASSGAACP